MMTPAATVVARKVGSKITVNLLMAAPKRWASSSGGAAANRVSGRSRFYKEVGTKSLDIAPWEGIEKTSSTSSTTSDTDNENVASPISAGVDGTQSATGVHHIPSQNKKSTLSLKQMLTPRFPGEEPTTANEDDNDNKNDNNTTTSSWYGVTLDGRKVSTPMGQTLAVPSETLAFMIAAEWDSQTKELQPSNMPLMTLACTALDQAALHPQFYRDEALQYLRTDTVR